MGAGCYKRDLASRLALLLCPTCALLCVFLHHVGVQTEGSCSGLNEMSFIVSGICMLGPQLVLSPVSMALQGETCHWGWTQSFQMTYIILSSLSPLPV